MSHSNESSAFNSPISKRRKTYPELLSLQSDAEEQIPALVPEHRLEQPVQQQEIKCPNLQDFEFKLNALDTSSGVHLSSENITAGATSTTIGTAFHATTSPRKSIPSIRIPSLSVYMMWNYLYHELTSTGLDEGSDLKTERVRNFLSVPFELENFMFYGYLICFDSFLYTFTILPLRSLIAFVLWIGALLTPSLSLKPAQKCDLMKMGLLIICTFMLTFVDSSKIYHSVRGQSVIKLYVIFNVLDVLSRLGSAFGHDILDSLFSKATMDDVSSTSIAVRRLKKSTQFIVALCYVFIHSMILFYQMISLNVAINSYSNSLLPIMLSSNFVEIKSSVFKKCDERNLFILACADVLERFHLSCFLFLIIIRNYLEMTGGSGVDEILSYLYDISVTILTSSTKSELSWLSYSIHYISEMFLDISSILSDVYQSHNYKLFITLLSPALYIIGTEILVDCLKHAFITKFNGIPSSVYTKFKYSLFRDLIGLKTVGDLEYEDHQTMAFVDRSPSVSRRIGFVALPLACLFARIIYQTMHMLGIYGLLMDSDSWKQSGYTPFKTWAYKLGYVFSIVYIVFIVLICIKVWVGLFLQNSSKKGLEEGRV